MAMDRWWLHIQAIIWRMLMRIGMVFHDFPFPSPPPPSFSRKVYPSVSSHGSKGTLKLRFYTPKGYEKARETGKKYPVVVNFHGGGFCLGSATDDTRWARSVTDEVDAVFVSVDYHLAPEYPFPAAVDDGVEALLYLAANAEELGIDPHKISLTGFSAGGNLAFTVALRLQYYAMKTTSNTGSTSSTSSDLIEEPDSHTTFLTHKPPHQSTTTTATTTTPLPASQLPTLLTSSLSIISIFSWYPILDFHTPRSHRRAQCEFPEKTLPTFFTDLFDESYLPHHPSRTSPYASPYLASSEILAASLPHDIFIYMCEWDMLLHEGQGFVKRLEGLGMRVRGMMIEEAPHAWDKSPNPFRDQESIDLFYRQACADMRAVFEQHGGVEGGGGG
ncbi:hypothetical protein FQN54_008313 [Arachnomyces sp. PD_36]|nr:hypothetical protein FQN54_008313 [Arachnomyces sp. PD_36]